MIVVAVAALLAAPCLVPPVAAAVVDPFRMPACAYCPGHRGIDFGPQPGQSVAAAAGGEVVFAGSVAGVRWVVVQHPDGLRASYGKLATITVSRGDSVVAGRQLGTTGDVFYFGLRDGDRPVDPTPLFGERRYPTRLVPSDGSAAPSVGPGRLVCQNNTGGR